MTRCNLHIVSRCTRRSLGGVGIFPAKILLVVDGSKESASAAEAAVELANATGSELHVVHAVSTAQELPYPRGGTKGRREAILEAKKLHALTLLDGWVGWIEGIGGKVAASHYREGKPEREAVRLAEELDVGLVVTGDRRPDWLERLLPKSLAGGVLRRANRPVLVVREPRRSSPRTTPHQG